jgi:hypothetical protein
LIYPAEQNQPIISVEIAYSSDVVISNSATPSTMLLFGFAEDYAVFPVPTNHVIAGRVDLTSFRKRRQIDFSLAGDATYYGGLTNILPPLLYIRTNTSSSISSGTLIGHLEIVYHTVWAGTKAVL